MGADDSRRLVLWTVGAVVGAFALLWLVYLARQALLLIYVSALLAMGIAPLVRWIERQPVVRFRSRPIPRWAAVLSVFVVAVATLGGLALAIVPSFVGQARAFARDVPQWFAAMQERLIAWGMLPEPITLREALEQAPAGGDLVLNVASTIWAVFGGLLGVVTLLFLTFYLVVDSRTIYDTSLRLLPRARRARAGEIACEIVEKASAWLGGQLILSAVIGSTAAIALGLMGVPYFYVLALIAAIGEAIPVIGPILAAIPAVVVAATVSPKLALGVAIFYLVQQQLESYVLVPKVMERQVGVNAVTVIVALLLGEALLGVIGAILAVPTAAIAKVVFDALTRDAPEERITRKAA
jgi:predicted PurR-regulated permease PerM